MVGAVDVGIVGVIAAEETGGSERVGLGAAGFGGAYLGILALNSS